jgi:hypothetical protein
MSLFFPVLAAVSGEERTSLPVTGSETAFCIFLHWHEGY